MTFMASRPTHALISIRLKFAILNSPTTGHTWQSCNGFQQPCNLITMTVQLGALAACRRRRSCPLKTRGNPCPVSAADFVLKKVTRPNVVCVFCPIASNNLGSSICSSTRRTNLKWLMQRISATMHPNHTDIGVAVWMNWRIAETMPMVVAIVVVVVVVTMQWISATMQPKLGGKNQSAKSTA